MRPRRASSQGVDAIAMTAIRRVAGLQADKDASGPPRGTGAAAAG